MENTAEQRIKERTQRVEDALALKVPDRVPLVISFGLFSLFRLPAARQVYP